MADPQLPTQGHHGSEAFYWEVYAAICEPEIKIYNIESLSYLTKYLFQSFKINV